MEYTQVLQKVLSGEVDAAVWNMDEIRDKLYDMSYRILDFKQEKDTEAVIVVKKDRKELVSLIGSLIDADVVLKNQQLVMEGKLIASY